jgi:hypothetical protein
MARPNDCTVCYLKFASQPITRVPKMLPCGHTLCRQCVESLAIRGKLSCPLCRVEVRLGTDGTATLPTNHSLLDVLEAPAAELLVTVRTFMTARALCVPILVQADRVAVCLFVCLFFLCSLTART